MSHQLLHANTSFLAAAGAASIAVVAVALVIDRLARRASPASGHAILLTALLAPAVLFAGVALDLRLPLRGDSPATVGVQMAAAEQASVPEAGSEIACALALVWLLGAVSALARTTARVARWRGVAARAEIIWHDGFDSPHDLARSTEVCEPAVIGIISPMVVLPAGYDLDPDGMRAVFAHELAHVRRRDNLTALVVQVVNAFFWFDPLRRLATRRLFDLRERVCDEIVLDRGCDPSSYVSALARSCESSLGAHPIACMSRSNLEERMESIMTHHARRSWPVSLTRGLVAGVAAAAAITFASVAPAPSLAAGERAENSPYDFDVRVTPQADGRFTVAVRIESPDGNLTSAAVVPSVPDTRTISTTHRGKTYSVVVNLAADGSAIAQFEVREGEMLLTTAAKTFSAPAQTSKRETLAPGVRRMGEAPNMTPPRAVYRVEPHYPGEARVARVAGVVILETVIDENGTVGDVRVLKPLPYGLDRAAMEAVKQWRFEPATLEGKPVPVLFNITFSFRPE